MAGKPPVPVRWFENPQLTVRSLPEAREALAALEFWCERQGLTLGGARPKNVAILNALILAVGALPARRRQAILADGLARLEALLASPGPMPEVAAPIATKGAKSSGPRSRAGR